MQNKEELPWEIWHNCLSGNEKPGDGINCDYSGNRCNNKILYRLTPEHQARAGYKGAKEGIKALETMVHFFDSKYPESDYKWKQAIRQLKEFIGNEK